MSKIKVRAIARIDGDEFLRAMKIAALPDDTEIGVSYEIDIDDNKISCDSPDEVVAFLMAIRPKKSVARVIVEPSAEEERT